MLFVAGMLHRLDGSYEKALATYDRLLEVNPRDLVVVAINRARILTHQGRFEEAVAEIDRGRQAEPEHPLLKTFLAVALLNQGMVDDAQALLEDVLRQNPHFDGVLPLLGWCLSARGQHEAARALITERVREVATADHDIAIWLASFYAMEDMRDEAIEWVRLAVRIGNENYPLLARTRQARLAARRPALRRDPRGAAPGMRGAPAHGGRLTMSAPEDLVERIRLRLDESFVGIGEVVAELLPADVADLLNRLTRQEAASVLSMLAVPRAVEVFDQPTLNRRSAILEQMEPGRAAQILEGLSADERTFVVRGMGELRPPPAAPEAVGRGPRRGRAPAAVPAAQRRRHHDHRVRPARAELDGRRVPEAHPLGGPREGVDLRLLRDGARHRRACSARCRCATS